MKRFPEIDFIRGISMLAVILIHTTYYFQKDEVAYFLWNYSQFAVQAFLFCSAYVYFKKDSPHNITQGFSYIKKRFVRLLLPYYFFLIFFIPVLLFFYPHTISTAYIIESILSVGGVDINWLVLLFLQLSIIFPLMAYWAKKKKVLFYSFF